MEGSIHGIESRNILCLFHISLPASRLSETALSNCPLCREILSHQTVCTNPVLDRRPSSPILISETSVLLHYTPTYILWLMDQVAVNALV